MQSYTLGASWQAKSLQDAVETVIEEAYRLGRVAVDTETVSLNNRELIGIGIWAGNKGIYAATDCPYISKILKLLADPAITKVYYNCMFDLTAMSNFAWDYNFAVPDRHRIADVFAKGQVQALPSGLAKLFAYVCHEIIQEISDILPKNKTMLDLPLETVVRKCINDSRATYRLDEVLGGAGWEESPSSWMWQPPELTWRNGEVWDPSCPESFKVTEGMVECYQTDLKLVPILLTMGVRGIALRADLVEKWYNSLSNEILFYDDLFAGEGINPGSPQQVGLYLADRGNLLPINWTKLVTDFEALGALDDPMAAAVLNRRKAVKLRSTYIVPWKNEPRATTNFRIDLATGRLASYNRNLQNVPVSVREIFKPDSGLWTTLDANQIEMRIFALASQDRVMLKAYETGEDIHSITQATLWPGSDLHDDAFRKPAKTFNFAMIFNAKDETLSLRTGLPLEVCSRFKRLWLDRYPDARDWMAQQEAYAARWGYGWSIFGRKIRQPDIMMASQRHLDNTAVNYPIQGSAADYIKRCMLRLADIGVELVLQVHDEFLVEGHIKDWKLLPELIRVKAKSDWEYEVVFPGVHPDLEVPFKARVSEFWVKP